MSINCQGIKLLYHQPATDKNKLLTNANYIQTQLITGLKLANKTTAKFGGYHFHSNDQFENKMVRINLLQPKSLLFRQLT